MVLAFLGFPNNLLSSDPAPRLKSDIRKKPNIFGEESAIEDKGWYKEEVYKEIKSI